MNLSTLTRFSWPHCISLLAITCLPTVAFGDDAADALFENHIRPVLVESCFRCHGDARVSGMLRVDSRESLMTGGESGAAIVPGHPDESLLIKAIRRHDDVSAMPPEKEKALRPDQIASFEAWIKSGAEWPVSDRKFEGKKHWSFEPVLDPPRPTVTDKAWSTNSIDAFIRSAQEVAGAKPAPQSDKLTLIRRATFDLTGLPPTPDEVDEFLNDSSANAFEKVVDRLLSSPHYGERWGRHWLDVVRYADTAGETADYPVPTAWRYRNYVIDAFNKDKPYDQFLREQIAGDIIANQSPTENYAELVTATGYLAISRRFGFDSENYHHLTIQDTIDTLGQSVLGLSLGCARCHDHKFDAVSMNDYYGLYGIFDSSRYAFPGSEQKQKFRSLVPLLPLNEANAQWRAFDQKVANLTAQLEKQKQPVPTAILRSLNDLDGDFEMQAPAAGGSNGVLVPPWLYEGKIAVTNAAQSPFKNVYARGRVGASIAPGTGTYRIAQSLYPRRSATDGGAVYVNLDFRIGPNDGSASGLHQFRIGSIRHSSAVIVAISSNEVSLRNGETSEPLGAIHPNEWYNLQLNLDLESRMVAGTLSSAAGANGDASSFSEKPFSSDWAGEIDYAELSSFSSGETSLPGIEYDNLAVQGQPMSKASTELPTLQMVDNADPADLSRQMQELAGLSGDFEGQTVGSSPGRPWNPGPNSVVQVSQDSQSPYRNVFPGGDLRIHMPNRGDYDGFGLTLPQSWRAEDHEWLFACFDFRCADASAGGDGSWRYYVGHGPGNSAAVELFFNGSQFYRRSADAREAVSPLSVGEWYQVQLQINLKSRRYDGTISSKSLSSTFSGELATGWDGTIDYSFIDSYGHLGGVRPAIDVDNYEIGLKQYPTFDSPPVDDSSPEFAAKREKAAAVRKQLAAIQAETKRAAEELSELLTNGPFPMAYGMAEGTPHNVHVQLRGEPGQPGNLVDRGFVKAVGGQGLASASNASGSGRLELAEWLTSTDNPLTSRVMVNRIWQYHFGKGLVKTPNDFGVRGLQPTHPQLLDHLASEFMRSGWSMKSMHRLIMLSKTYQQSSEDVRDSENSTSLADTSDLYTHFARRRLTAEEIRDAILTVSGQLDSEPGQAHPFPSPISWGFSQHGPFNAVYDHNKRSVYLMTQRLKRHPFLGLFDGPDPNASTADRLGTTVPTQALFFLNDPFVHEKANAWAVLLLNDSASESQQIDLAYRTMLGRSATGEEQQDASEFLIASREELRSLGQDNPERLALASFLRTLLGSNAFLHID